MSFLSLAFAVCTPLYCNTYNIDTFDNSADGLGDCKDRLKVEMASFVVAWDDTSSVIPLRDWMANHQIFEEPAEVVSYNFECKKFDEPQDAPSPELMYAGN